MNFVNIVFYSLNASLKLSITLYKIFLNILTRNILKMQNPWLFSSMDQQHSDTM